MDSQFFYNGPQSVRQPAKQIRFSPYNRRAHQTRNGASPVIQNPGVEAVPITIVDGRDDHVKADGDDDDNSDDSSASLFGDSTNPVETSTDTNSSLDPACREPVPETEVKDMDRSRAGQSQERPIVLEDDANHETAERAPPRPTKHGQGLCRGYDSRIPIQLRNSEVEDDSMSDRERDGSFEGAGRQEEKVWEYDGFAGYRVVGGVPEVAVRWRSTWEPAADFPLDEMAAVKRKWQRGRISAAKELRSKGQRKGRGRPRQRLTGGAAPAAGAGL